VKGIVITHGHEDHIGALPHVLNYVNVPIFGSRMTNALIEKKFNEKGSKKINPKLNTVKENQKIKLGRNFEIEFVHVNHSIAGAFALAIHTPVGTWVHTGDFKIDYTPIDGKVGNLSKLAKLGEKGVLLLTADSTNAERSGSTISEKNVGETLEALVEQYKDKRIIVSTFASNIYRVQQLVSLAEQTNRKIVFSGRSMLNVTEIAAKIGELKINKDVIIPINKLNKYKRNEVMIISTGSQGEPFSALTRMSSGDFKGVKLDENDAVILSASPIPGNEKAIGRVINNLYKSGAEVIYNKLAEVHVSGHAKAEELKLLHTLVKPKFFIPAHGEYRMLKAHEEIAHSLGMPKRRTLIAEIGDAVELTSNNIKRLNKVQAGRVLVDGFGFGDMESDALRDRKQLAEDGICVVTLGVNSATGRVEVGPEILAKGFLYSSDNANLIEGAKKNVLKSIEGLDLKKKDKTVIQEAITKSLTKYFSTKARRRPMVLPFIMEL
ncbi:MAG: ribonuclease J, partial [Halanaerobiales bacterium]